ncbi:MAG: 3-deoxy-manno-octulosonate cytidylyltransferase [Planctomycetota bacterium]|nr:3-deoxy-manno-octulosonate cytidylyltransferase [Planctomycetota bacterium]
MKVTGIIPARLQSSRLPGKLLLAETGKPLIQHTWESASCASVFALNDGSEPNLLIATDSLQIAATVSGFGGRVKMTGEHPCGTDRIAEVVRKHLPNSDIIVNIQGDEPDIDPESINKVAQLLIDHPQADMATLCAPITDAEILNDPGCVKAVCAADGRALYFSRCPVPFMRDGDRNSRLSEDSPWKLHLGIYAYRRQFLLYLAEQPPSPLEELEKLEQLRALELGATILIAEVPHRSVGIDTREDYARFVARRKVA